MKILVELPGSPGQIVDPDDHGTVVATTVDGNPLAPGWDAAIDVAASSADRPLILWSGSRADSLFEPHPHTWGAPGWDGLEQVCRTLSPLLDARDAVAYFRPHARHVLSDAPSCRRFLADHRDGPFRVALAPALLLEPSMLPEIEDHLERIFEAVASAARFLFLSDIAVEDDGETCRPVPLGAGIMSREHLRTLVDRFVPPETPIVLIDEALADQRRWLEAS